ncbi:MULTISPECIES: N-acetyl-gamma-glutamyl-phosphate reductase [Clostridium]|uniref:N-acetyl-gamma-glutamyl-phosphate reductase n=1 Tax=Clostridium novyi (strain NT) TaxID=386415 RepID=ARGC_CLONN|nr:MULTISPECIES: N-acetyl-gamma-glutamyl-phosphate reductase [Clostridium]A0Q1F0.1 RecName: Full=N-acetyl-gamma-glutamyl-phosphate reductase; Short=AGPR; AltName: Full=N-acetyl-glutamate semialdehyde dehydrogenase; Short=NAGSA dehydrogenase [Clostridium novyi NT]ABK61967.1 N-acetyl-gamma-glutamyl-phosphate reductase [Clostridium novyi NT]KEH88179.1 N-acetyl-gamma-glutamyl-phosphate reductase [Clostridium novyi A str. NCTC 538]KEH89385.1 N-acetyl-gamma-glutamyl-phosphate reductase [Clostridium n
MIKVGIIGSTGYIGQQLVWLLKIHPNVEIVFLSSYNYAGYSFNSVYNNYKGFVETTCINIKEVKTRLKDVDIVFMALPHGKSFEMVKYSLNLGIKVIDLSGDFRLKDSKEYEKWYKIEHPLKEVLKYSVYGLPELFRKDIKKASLICNPGCYATASILALAPLIKLDLVEKGSIIVDAKSGVSGAGRALKTQSLYCECNETMKAYGIGNHRHTPEIEQELSRFCKEDIKLTFTPHLVPINRGIFATCYATLKKDLNKVQLEEAYEKFYENDYFIKVMKELVEVKWIKNSNFCNMNVNIDERTNKVIVSSVIDNLMKGAASQAVQNMNILFGIDEKTGLNIPSMMI